MFFSQEDQEAVEFQCPVSESDLTVEELLSLLQVPGNSNNTSHNSGLEGSSRAVYSVEERKRRRMISNRESAQRSRWRKKRHLEDLTEQANRLRLENRVLKNRLGLLSHCCHVAWRENDRLSYEFFSLRSRLSDLCRILVAMQSQQ